MLLFSAALSLPIAGGGGGGGDLSTSSVRSIEASSLHNQAPLTATHSPSAIAATHTLTANRDAMTTKDQLLQAEQYLRSLRSDRAKSCERLEEEAKVFLESPSTEEQKRRFRLVNQLVRYQVRKCGTF